MSRNLFAGILLALLTLSACSAIAPAGSFADATPAPLPTVEALTPYSELSSLPGGTFTLVPPGGNGITILIGLSG